MKKPRIRKNIIPIRIKEARSERGYSCEVLGNKIGVSRQAISQYELGIIKPAFHTFKRLISVLNYPESFFYEDSSSYEEQIINIQLRLF
ncbi:MAG: helix-turn-helix transcriptional regulator [Defluviitaleaceae bacterium]|nr:helix-turn-helix transcriptional regulator [Defluviitaleaceae bacterium]